MAAERTSFGALADITVTTSYRAPSLSNTLAISNIGTSRRSLVVQNNTRKFQIVRLRTNFSHNTKILPNDEVHQLHAELFSLQSRQYSKIGNINLIWVPHGSTYPLLIELFTHWSKYALLGLWGCNSIELESKIKFYYSVVSKSSSSEKIIRGWT